MWTYTNSTNVLYVCTFKFFSKCPDHHVHRNLSTIIRVVVLQHELPVYEAFSSPEFVSKLISFLSLEEIKGKDRFDTYKFHLFKVTIHICIFGTTLSIHGNYVSLLKLYKLCDFITIQQSII